MGGAAGSSGSAYFLGNNNKVYYESPLPMGTTEAPSTGATIASGLATYDIAREGDANGNSSTGDMWVATDDADSPIRAYNTSGNMTSAINLIPAALGMAYSSSGSSRYIWASNPDDDKIYQIELDETGVAEESSGAIQPLSLCVSGNPFTESIIISGAGFSSSASIRICDINGRIVVESEYTDNYNWNDSALDGSGAPPGVYFVRVSDHLGRNASISVTRICN